MTKQYVETGTHVEADAVDFTVADKGTSLCEAALTRVSTLKVWVENEEIWREVRWDFSTHLARPVYFD